MSTDWYREVNGGESVERVNLFGGERGLTDIDGRRVAREEVVPGVEVSTVFLCLDHNWGDGPPLLYETLVFGGVMDGDCERYSTRAQAVVGHVALVAKVREAEGRGVTP